LEGASEILWVESFVLDSGFGEFAGFKELDIVVVDEGEDVTSVSFRDDFEVEDKVV
jgi:hypothetical protein